jgi:hypothetical protein
MTSCPLHASGSVELYFYGELDTAEYARLERHLTGCDECRRALDDLQTIRAALAARPDVSAPAGGDWTSFMARLDDAVRHERGSGPARSPQKVLVFARTRSSVGYLAMAALLALVTVSVVLAWRSRTADVAHMARRSPSEAPIVTSGSSGSRAQGADAAFLTLSEQHFERSKLVVLGLATKDPADASGADWEYERELAGALLTDTRLYRLAAEERGLGSLARVMQDLELVLLQASMSDKPDASALEALQRVIRKRDLLTKIELVTTTAGI